MSAPQGPDPFPLSFFLTLLVSLWLVIPVVLALAAGHMSLLARFPPVDEPMERTFVFASGQMRWVSFGNALHVGIGARGLHLAANFIFRPLSHRGIPCIPWRELRLVRSQSEGMMARFLGSKFEVSASGLRFTVAGAPGRAVEQRLGAVTAQGAHFRW